MKQSMSNGQRLTLEFLNRIVASSPPRINYRPDWLQGLELDFYYPDLKFAVEFNGDQHYHYTEFGSPAAQKRRDRLKKKICREMGVKLLSVTAIDLIWGRMRMKIKKAIGKKSMLRCNKGSTGKKNRGNKGLNSKGIKYRQVLIERYNSPTARRFGKEPAKKAARESYERWSQPKSSESN